MSETSTEDGFRALATGLPQLVFGCRGTGERTWPSPQWTAYCGLSAARSGGFGWLEALHPDDRQATLDAWARAPAFGEFLIQHRIRRASDGQYRWHLTRAVPLPGAPDGAPEWVGSSVDVHEMHDLHERIAEAERQLRIMVEGVPQLLWRSCNLGDWTWSSPQWRQFTGQTREQSLGRGWLDVVHPDDHAAAVEAWAGARAHGELDVEFRVRRAADGAYLWHRTRSTPARDEAGSITEWLGTTTDVHDLRVLQERQKGLLADLQRHARDLESEIGERKRAEARLLYDAQHDGLTGLHNRAFLMNRIGTALDRPDARCAVLFLDLDRFKIVNDSLGHRAGDILLVEIAARLKACVAADHVIARFGGDEFTVLIEQVEDAAVALSLAAAIVEALRRPLWIAGQEIFAACSIGIVQNIGDYLRAEDVLRDADIAMYHAKRNSNGGFAVFTEDMRAKAVAELDLRTDLRNAVARREFILHYQPICDTSTGTISGLEALVRWRHPRFGVVSPGSFIAIAEETGLIRDIGRWVLWEASAQMKRWRSDFPSLDLHLSVNASGEELKMASYPDEIRSALSVAELDPGCLQIEITESVFLHEPERIGEALDTLRGMGIRIALDDFGTGYSSLSYLDRFRVDALKIDKAFVDGLPSRPMAVAIVDAVVRLAQRIGLDIVAEGVERDDQLQLLRALSCHRVQGYLLGRPMPPAAITEVLARQPAPASQGPGGGT